MTKVTDLEASFEQYKVEQAASQAELKETMEKNKADADKQFAEILQLLKTRQPAAAATTIPPPLHTQPLQSYPTMLLQHPNTTTTSLPPTFALPQWFFPAPNQTIPPPLVHGNERGWVPGIDYRLRKLKMPLFNGDNVYGWVYLAERFFDIQGLVTSEERLKAAMMCLEGPALSWFRWTHNREPFRSWEDLKRRMLVRFQSSQAGTLNEQFFAISQSGTARDYINMFEKMAAQLPRLQEEVLEGIFIKGLKQELRTAVRTQKPTGLSQAMELALIIDETSKGGAPFKRMTDSEFADKRAKGLCYRCDGQYGPGHRCPEKALQVLLVDDEEEEKEGGMTRNTLHLEAIVVFLRRWSDDINVRSKLLRKIKGG
ncbi:ankyrin repeat-containing protein [Tanacetum coccineum]